MESKLSVAILCFLGLFVITQGETLQVSDLKDLQRCWTYTNCEADGPTPSKDIKDCIDILKPDELESFYQYIKKNNFEYDSDTFIGSIKESCDYDEDKQKEAYDKSVNGVAEYQMKICDDSGDSGECSRFGQALGCVLLDLKNLRNNDKC